jgi:ssDNA thymidine ADP-ribosyltransferase, DarT
MAKPDQLSRIKGLYHFTDASNIASIRQLGGLWCTAKLREMGVEFRAGGNEHSLDADAMFGMDQYVHLCFHGNHPMEHLASQDGRIKKTQWLYIDDAASLFELDGVRYSPGVSNKSGMEPCPIEEASGKIDYTAHFEYLDWTVDENYQRRLAAEKCEILVPQHLPLKYFEKFLPIG